MGQTPYGYIRVYPESIGGRRPAGALVPHEPEASIVRWLFASNAQGTWSTRMLADDLNERGVPPPKPTDEDGNARQWSAAGVRSILTNQTYAASTADSRRGSIVYGKDKMGYYMQTPGGVHTGQGKHQPLVSREVWEQVQARLAAARCRSATPGRQHRSYLVAGLLRCQDCGRLMIPSSDSRKPDDHGQVWCASRHHGQSRCTAGSYRLDLATAALLAQVRRLRSAPWTPRQERLLSGEDGATAEALERELAEARETLTRANRRFMVEIKEPTKEDRDAFEAVRCEMGARIRDLEQQQAQLKHDAQTLPRLHKLHKRLKETQVGDLIDKFQTQRDEVGLRDLVTGLVQSAMLVERYPQTRSTWLRLQATWQPDVQRLLDAGLLTLAPEPQRPLPEPIDPQVAARRARQARFRAKRKAATQCTGRV